MFCGHCGVAVQLPPLSRQWRMSTQWVSGGHSLLAEHADPNETWEAHRLRPSTVSLHWQLGVPWQEKSASVLHACAQ
jgi:hypothetical protein